MDRSPRRPSRLIALAAVGVLGAAALAPAPPLRAMQWLAPGVDPVAALTQRPTECLALPKNIDAAYEVRIGQAAFRTPLALGGQAARAGLSCDSCHRSGRGNLDFSFPGVSGAPGTADVTGPEFSSHEARDLGPVPIPNLSGPKSALSTPQDAASGALEARIATIATNEFDGNPLPPTVLKGLAAYVRALSPDACPAARRERVDVRRAMDEVATTAVVAMQALERGDPDTAIVMLESARSQLGDIDERYAGPDLTAERAQLATSARFLGQTEDAARRPGGAALAKNELQHWFVSGRPALATALDASEARSLYNAAVLAEAVRGRDARPPAP